MEGSENIIQKRKEKIINWFKDPLNLTLTGILLFAFSIRLYYFILVGNQPLWWDEACYGSLARNLISGIWNGTNLIVGETLIRPPLFPFLWSLLMRLNLSETISRFFLEFIPSVLSVFFVYLVGKEIFNKKTGLIAAFIFSVLWIHIFYTIRLLTNIPAMAFLFLSVYYFIISTKKKLNLKFLTISLFLLSISTLMRYPNGIIFFVYFIILLIGKQVLIKEKFFWISGIIGILPMFLFFLINLIKYGNIFPAFFGGGYINTGESIITPFAYNLLNFIPAFLQNIFFIFFILGLIIILFHLLISYNFVHKKSELRNSLLIILFLVSIYSFFIFYMRGAEDRWLFATTLPICIIAARGINFSSNFIKRYSKHLALLFILIILAFGAYGQIKFADSLIENRKESFLQIRQAFEWIEQNTLEDAVITGAGFEPYGIYYSNRFALTVSNGSEKDKIGEADYLILHAFTPQPEYLNEYLAENTDKWQPINAWFFDAEQKQPAVIIYKRIK